jgi:predicted metal-dependent phosphoesterase TrpH
MRLGYVTSVKEGFQKLLGAKCGYYTPPKHIDAFELISIIRNLGAVPILAHPFLSIKDEQQLEAFLAKAAACGLLGIETRYPLFSDEQTSSLEILAKKYGLAQSGGSDFHGENKPDIRLGSGKGALQVPLSFLNDLRQRTI